MLGLHHGLVPTMATVPRTTAFRCRGSPTTESASTLPSPLGGSVKRFVSAGVACLLALAATSAQAQQTRDGTGKVTSAANGQPLADVTVGVIGQAVGARTNAAGEYRLHAPAGDIQLSTRLIGYKRQ